MNWNDPAVKLSLKELQELLDWRGRDSRIVRAAFAWSRLKKRATAWLKKCLEKKQISFVADDTLRVLFWLPGGMGDAACSKRLVSAYRARLPKAQFEIYAPLPGVANMLFGAEKNTVILTKEPARFDVYDLAVQAGLAVKFLQVNESRLEQLAPAFMPTLFRAQEAQCLLGNLLEDLFLTEGVLGRWMQAQGGRRFDLLSFTGGVELLHDAQERLKTNKKTLSRFGLQNTAYITFHDGTSEAQKISSSRPTRSWPMVRWCEFFRLFKREFPDIKIVQLGGTNSPTYEEADVCLVGKTEVADLPSLLDGAQVHIDTESGLVHLAQFLKTRSVVLLGPSAPHFFAYAKNENLSAGDCHGCMWTTADWMMKCPVGHSPAPCVEAIRAQEVLAAVKRLLAAR